jgi:RNA recognition motif-containing protein
MLGYGYQQLPTGYTQPYHTTQASSSSSMSAYSANQYGLPVNISHGAVAVEHRGIHIGGISKKCNDEDVRKLLRRTVGEPISLKLLTDTSGKFRGTAVAEFSTAEEASNAADALNGYNHKGRTLTVRLSREAQPAVSPSAPPVVVNGSTYSG